MPSAKMLAQKPAGNLSPLSVSGHAALADFASVGALCAGIETPAAQIAPSIVIANPEFLYRTSDMVLFLSIDTLYATRPKIAAVCNLDPGRGQ